MKLRMKLLAFFLLFGLFAIPTANVLPSSDVSVVFAVENEQSASQQSNEIENTKNSNLNIQIKDGKISGGIAEEGGGKAQTEETGNKILGTLTTVFTFVLAGAAITLGIIFIVHCVSLAKNANNPNGKTSSISGLLFTLIASALCGGAAVFMGLAFNVFR